MIYTRFQELPIWRDSIEVAADIFKFCGEGQVQREFRLKDQLTSACTSISSNIAEWFEYYNNRQFIRYLTYAKGSASETISLLHVLQRSEMISEVEFKAFSGRISSLANQIGGFIKYLERLPAPQRP
jgi:four helix bundle protein